MGLINLPLQSVLFVIKFHAASQLSSPQGCCLCRAASIRFNIRRISMCKHRQCEHEATRQTCCRETDACEQMAPRRRRRRLGATHSAQLVCLCARGQCTETLVRSPYRDVPRLPEKPCFRAKRSALIFSANLKSSGFATY